MFSASFPRMHVSLYVSNIQDTINFYTSFFGQAPEKVKSNYAKYLLSSPSLIISFVENQAMVASNFGHLGFQVASESDLNRMLESCEAKGLSVTREIGTACCYAVQDKFWVADPDGFQWEVYLFREDAEFNDIRYQDESVSACCMPSQHQEVSTSEVAKVNFRVKETVANTCSPGGGCC